MDKRPNIFILYEMPHSCKHFMCQQGKKKLKIVLNVTNIYINVSKMRILPSGFSSARIFRPFPFSNPLNYGILNVDL